MARITKEDKARRNVNRLANIFGVAPPEVSVGTAGRATNGLYRREQVWESRGEDVLVSARILLDRNLTKSTILETTAHEFAHHLLTVWQINLPSAHCYTFWSVLACVRGVIYGTNEECYTTLEYSALDRVHKSWL